MTIKINGTNTTAQPSITGTDTDTGLVYGTGEVSVVTDGTERLKVDSSGNVGIGESNPTQLLVLKSTAPRMRLIDSDVSTGAQVSGSGGNLSLTYDILGVGNKVFSISDSVSEKLRIDSLGNVGIGTASPVNSANFNTLQLGNGTSTSGQIALKNTTNQDFYLWHDGNGVNIYNQSATSQIFYTGATERMRIQSTGGISFNGDTATANALDDYEEGTWTPTIGGGTAAGSMTAGTGYGIYTKIGRQVSVGVRFDNFTLTGATGGVKISGLPFAASGFQAYSTSTAPMLHNISFNTERIQSFYHGTSNTDIYGIQSRHGLPWLDWDVSNFNGSGKYIRFSMVYQTAT